MPKLQSNPPSHCKNGHEMTPENIGWWASKKTASGVTRICKTCMRERMRRKREDPNFLAEGAERQRRWRQNNPEKYRAGYQRDQAAKKQILLDARKGGCVKCGETDPSCLDFHHRNGKVNKEGHIGEIRRFSIKRILAEIAKRDVYCANCHRKHHRDEREGEAA